MLEVNISSHKKCISMYPLYDVLKWYFTSVSFLSNTHNPGLNKEKKSDKLTRRAYTSYNVIGK